jgi:ABC-type multidrug transport system fused ATPase/permease subunit
MTIATLVASFVFAFVIGWLMTLVMLATLPALGIAGYFYIRVIGEKDR